MALKQIARVFEAANSDAEAESALETSILIDARQSEAIQHWIALRQRQCEWPIFSGLSQLKRSTLLSTISPLSQACYADDPVFQLANAYRYNCREIGRPEAFLTEADHRGRWMPALPTDCGSAMFPRIFAITPSGSR